MLTYDVLISAGHEGRPASCAHFPQHHCNLGAAGERAWTPIVADAATRILRQHGVSVVRLPADFAGKYRVGAAVFIHFDGSDPPCASSASVGYAHSSDAAAAAAWHRLYGRYWPFGFQPDNFTHGLRAYYAYSQVEARERQSSARAWRDNVPGATRVARTALAVGRRVTGTFLERPIGQREYPR